MLRRLFGSTHSSNDAAVNVEEAHQKIDSREAIMIDVRERDEWRAGHVKGARHIPLGDLGARLGEIPRDREVLLFCRSGNRSGRATQFLREQGYSQARNVEGGIIAWTGRGFPVE